MARNDPIMVIFVLMGILLSSVITATALEVTGASTDTNTVTGGSTVTYSKGQGGSGGGGGGGGGGFSGENHSNIEINEKYYDYIYKDKVTSFRFTERGNTVLFVNITGNTSQGDTRTSVEVLKGRSTLVKEPAPGTVYKNVNIWVGASGYAIPKNIKEAVIRFRVENTWISGNGLLKTDILMYKWDGNRWFDLETYVKGSDEIYSYFETRTDSFSSFAISGLKGMEVPIVSKPVAGITTMAVTAQAPEAVQSEKSPAFETGIMIIAVFAVYLYGRGKK